MTKVKFEVGKTYAGRGAGDYLVIARTEKTVILQKVKFQYTCEGFVRKDLDEVHRYKIREGWKSAENRDLAQEVVISNSRRISSKGYIGAYDDEWNPEDGFVNRQPIVKEDNHELDAEIDATVKNLKEELEIAKTELAEVEEEIANGNDVEQNEALKKEYLDEIEDIKHNLDDWLGAGAGDALEKEIDLTNCAGDCAITAEAQEIAVNAEIENANNAGKTKKTRLDKNIAMLKDFIKGIKRNIEQNKKELADFDKLVEENGIAPEIATLHRKTIEARLSIELEKLTENENELAELLNSAAEAEEISPSIEKIFAAVTTEIKPAEKNPLKAKVAEILSRPHKSVIDWSGTFDDMKISEILNLQKDLKKFLKLGQIDFAENIFSMLKTLCKNYRAVAA